MGVVWVLANAFVRMGIATALKLGPKVFALTAAGYCLFTNAIGRSVSQVLVYYLPAFTETLNGYFLILCYAQGWIDISFALNALLYYYTFVAVLAMTRFLLKLTPFVY
jgi:hypothetical protein